MSKKSSTLFIYFLLLVVCFVLLFFGTFSFFQPIPRVVTFFTSPLSSTLYNMFHASPDTSTIGTLTAENAVLRKKLVDQKRLQAENSALRDQFKINKPSSRDIMPVQVIGAPGFIPGVSEPEMLIVASGIKDGLQGGEAVIVKDNLIGRIARVSDSLAVVELLQNSRMPFTATTLETRAVGVINGENSSGLQLGNVMVADTLKRGDMVVTKGDISEKGTGYPPGLIVGTLVDTEKKPSALFQTARIKSLVDIASVTTVFIMMFSD